MSPYVTARRSREQGGVAPYCNSFVTSAPWSWRSRRSLVL